MSQTATKKAYDWTRLVNRVFVKADRQRIYDCWATEAGLTQWFLASAGLRFADGQPRGADQPAIVGDQFTWRWHGVDYVMEGGVLEAVATERFAFTFGEEGNVTVTLTDQDDSVLVEVTHADIPDTAEGRETHVECGGGWTFYLANLKAVLEGGIDLREKDPGRQHVVNR